MFSFRTFSIALRSLTTITAGIPLVSALTPTTPPSGVSITILNHNGPLCGSITSNLLDGGNSLSIEYSDFQSWTDVTERFNDHSCSVVLNVVYPVGWNLEFRDPIFQGWADVAQKGRAQFRAYYWFEPFNETTGLNDIDEIHVDGPLTGNYSLTLQTPDPRNQRSICGAKNATFTIATRITALGGIPSVDNPYPANVNISHRVTTTELIWAKCNMSSGA